MAGLSDLGMSKTDVLAIRRMLYPYIAPIAEFLGPGAEHEELEGGVNSEQKSGDLSLFTPGRPPVAVSQRRSHESRRVRTCFRFY